MMNLIRLTAIGVLLGALGGCVALQPAVVSTARPDASAAYLTGSFNRINSGGFAFIIYNTDTNQEYAMSLGEDTTWPKDVIDGVITIRVPEGRYAVTHWVTYGTLTKERSRLRPITNSHLSAPFTVRAGSVVYLGKFNAQTTRSGATTYYTIKPLPIDSRAARDAFVTAHPNFKKNPFTCLMCADSSMIGSPANSLKDFLPLLKND
jgi:hypothetical protein